MNEREGGREGDNRERRESLWWREGREEIVYPNTLGMWFTDC